MSENKGAVLSVEVAETVGCEDCASCECSTPMRKQITEADKDIIQSWYKKDIKSLDEFVKELNDEYSHDYGTICHALAAVAVQGARFMDRQSQGGITGFQAGAVMWEFIKNWMSLSGPLRLVQYKEMLYPHYEEEFQKVIDRDTFNEIKRQAEELLAHDCNHAHPDVVAHWKSVAAGVVPFGYSIKD